MRNDDAVAAALARTRAWFADGIAAQHPAGEIATCRLGVQLCDRALELPSGPLPERRRPIAGGRHADLWSLDVALAVALRGGDLAAVAALLRDAAASADACERPLIGWATSALVAEQRPDGGFGSGGRDAPRPALTLTCAWALAEVRCPGVTAQAQRTPA